MLIHAMEAPRNLRPKRTNCSATLARRRTFAGRATARRLQHCGAMARARGGKPPGRRRLDRAVAAFALLAFALVTVAAGHRYFHCLSMDVDSLSPCCSSAHDDAVVSDANVPAIDHERCCETKHFASLGAGFAQDARVLVPAPFLSHVRDALAVAPRSTSRDAVARDASRAGRARGGAREYRLRLMVSLT